MPISPSLSLSDVCGLLRPDGVGVASSVAMVIHSSEMSFDFEWTPLFFVDCVVELVDGELTGLKNVKRLDVCSTPLLRLMTTTLFSLS